MDAILFILGNLALFWAAYRLAARWAQDRLEMAIGWLALYPVLASLLVLAGGVGGWLRPLPMVGSAAALCVVAALTGRPGSHFLSAVDEAKKLSLKEWTGAALVGGAYLLAVIRAVRTGTTYFEDDFAYHAPAVAEWVQHGRFVEFTPLFLARWSLNAELFGAWLALPFRHDGLVFLSGLVWLALAGLAAGGLFREGGAPRWLFMLAPAVIMISNPWRWQTHTFTAVDLSGAAAMLTAMFFMQRAMGTERLGPIILAGLLAGYGAGVKATLLPVAAVLGVALLFAGGPVVQRWKQFLCYVMAGLLLGTVWYVRNFWLTGNPFFPVQTAGFAGPVGSAEASLLKLAGILPQLPLTWPLVGRLAYDYLNWPLPLGLLALAGYGRAVWAEVMRLPEATPALRRWRRTLLLAGVFQFAFHFFAPFCFGDGVADGVVYIYNRIVMVTFACGLLLATPLLTPGAPHAWIWQALLAAGLLMAWPWQAASAWAAPLAALVGVGIWRLFPRGLRPAKVIGMGVALCVALALAAPALHETASRSLAKEKDHSGVPLASAIHALEQLPAGSRVTRYARNETVNAPLYGRRWQLQYITTDSDGQRLKPFHELFAEGRVHSLFWNAQTPLPPAKVFCENLAGAQVEYVLVTRFGGPTAWPQKPDNLPGVPPEDDVSWPPQERLLAASGCAQVLFHDENSTLWHVLVK